MIENIVISGGATSGILMIGIFRILSENNIYKRENIKRIYATSVGTIISLLLCLNIEWESIYTYVIDRPWEKVINIEPEKILNGITNIGFLSSYDLLKEFFIPLFKVKDIDIDITLKEFYEFCKIELNIITTEVENLQEVQISFKTHPDMKLLTALSMSTALPIIIHPVLYNEKYYADGGLVNNFPIQNCINEICNSKNNNSENDNVNEQLFDSILCVTNDNKSYNCKSNTKLEFDTIFDYFSHLTAAYIRLSQKRNKEQLLNQKNFIYFYDESCGIEKLKKVLYKKNRKELLEKGEQIAKEYLNKIKDSESQNSKNEDNEDNHEDVNNET